MLSSKETIRIYKYNGISIYIKQMPGQSETRTKNKKKAKKKRSTNPDEETTTNKLVVSAVVDLQLSRSHIIVHYSN
jgi:hypothetical protein